MFERRNDEDYSEPFPGIRMKTVCYGDKTLMVEFLLAAGSTLPRHAHPHEQTGYLVSGHMKLLVGDDEYDVQPGDTWCIAGDVEHGAEIVEDSIAVEVFSPVREDLLPEGAGYSK